MTAQHGPGVAGKRVVITGATGGIGLAAARRLADMGANVTIVGRSAERARAAAESIARGGDGIARGGSSISRPVDVLLADLASHASVRHLAHEILDRYETLDVLVNNAGAMFATRQLSPEGIEMTWALNHLAPFLLSTLLQDRLTASAPARIVTTASAAHYGARIPFDDLQAEHGYPRMGFGRYGESKLANILFTAELARRLSGTGVTANCFHPGFVGTGFNHNNGPLLRVAMFAARLFSRSPERGADTLVWLVSSPDVEGISGKYFFDRRERRPSQAARDPEAAQRLWRFSEEQIAVSTRG
jgi:NAD(P)-dependent dehydrogenase (short-subunit alcohol dehydrogenase family)